MNKRWLIVWTMAIGIFLCMLDTTIMNIALPAIQHGLNVSLDSLTWALNVYTIFFAVLTIPLGQIADRLGRNRVYVFGLALFIAGSIISASAPAVWTLIIGRAVQSVGAAIVFPSSMTIGLGATDLRDRKIVLTILGMTQGFAATLGPVVGGVITTWLGWRWVFWINVPLGLIAMALCLNLLPMHQAESAKHKGIDLAGMFTAMIMLFSLTVGLIYGRAWGWLDARIIGLFAVMIISLIVFVQVERRVRYPMVPLELFKSRQFSGSALASVIAQMLIVGVSVILPTFLTNVQNHTELVAALLITPMSVMTLLVSPISGALLDRLGPRLMVFTGMFLLVIGYAILATMNPTVYWEMCLACIFVGSGFGVIAGPIMILGAADFTGPMLTASQSVLGVIKQIGTLLAVAIFVSALTANIQSAKSQSVRDVTRYSQTLKLPKATQAAFAGHATAAIKRGSDAGNSGATSPESAKPTNQTDAVIAKAAAHVAQHTKGLIVQAFFLAYRGALPVAVLAVGISLCFERKRQAEKQAEESRVVAQSK
ncbi:MFS transporter [Lacticaseibacillus pabuli]|uniref:MFS transporter n=1 Tax=Lacticaseibacillus pabuli TaxID=3025672 RepID=A0ABY7WSZ1_9LACO|nr:MFS transporter [Lacticaseibacillus sp. KACC 23028]WDF83277.1 MFS transporter [Lacticaseibacillus sp. KACC 23028]